MPHPSPEKRPAATAVLLKHFAAIVAVLIIAGCSGGGCGGGGCASCGGLTPLPNGFDTTKRIENAGSVRLTQSGIGFLQANLATLAKKLLGGMAQNGVLDFSIPSSSGSTTGINYSVCPNGPMPNASPPQCTAEIDLGAANLTITPTGPHDLVVSGTLPVRLQDLPLHVSGLCVGSFCLIDTDVTATLNGDGSCPGGSYDQVPLNIDIQIHYEANPNVPGVFGFSQVTIPSILDSNATNNIDSSINICGGALGSILNAVKGLIVGQLTGPLTSTLGTQINNALCMKATAATPCPAGTMADGNMICQIPNSNPPACASILLGTEGNLNLGALLAALSPGNSAGLDFLFAAGGSDKNTTDPAASALSWGDLDPVNNGGTLGMYGGAEANPLSKCVPMSSMPLPTAIPIPAELYGNTVPNWPSSIPGPHVGIALSERFSNYALNSVYNSGLLCLGITSDTIPQLSSGTLSLLAMSLKDLGLQREPQQVAIVIRPSSPPVVTFGNGTDIGTDPLLDVKLKQFNLDFYIFSLDRFIRFMTATYDLDVPVNLSVTPQGLLPVIGNLGVANGTVTNSSLLSEDPATLATALGGLLSGLVGQEVGNALKPINLNTSLASTGLALTIPDSGQACTMASDCATGVCTNMACQGSPGLIKMTQGTDNYLGIWASLGLAGAMGPTPGPEPKALVSHTRAKVTKKSVDPKGHHLATIIPDNLPKIEILATSSLDDGTHALEYQYKVDQGAWRPFTRSRFLDVRDEWLRIQARHAIFVRSRVAGEPLTLDPDEAEVEVVIDVDPPTVKIKHGEDGKLTIVAKDSITTDPLVRYRLDQGAWSGWMAASQVPALEVGNAAEISVEAQDEEGNIGTATQPLIRGRSDGAVAAACGCGVVGSSPAPARGLWVLAFAVAGVFARMAKQRQRARRVAGGAAVVAFASTWAGCSCGNNQQTNATSSGGHTTSSSGASSSSSSSGGDGCVSPCQALEPGLIGEYSSVAVTPSGDVWVAGYSEADWNNDNQYGDLVAGKWDGMKVAWDQVDGVPSMPAVDPTMYDIHGFRGGQTAPGDDVGLWTSIVIGADGNPNIAYYDRTNRALKFAQYNGMTWAVHTVDSGMQADAGKYAKMLLVGSNFVIAYQSIAAGGTNGALVSKVRVATSAGATPAAGTWTFEDAAVVMTSPCRAYFCASTEACVVATKTCTATVDMSMCNPSCASGTACIGGSGGPTCTAIWDNTKIDAYADAIGDYITAAPDGMGGVGIAYYDRTNGNLMTAAKSGGTWTTLLVDGEGVMGNTGDSGIGASLFIDGNGDWNITYVNGYTEALQYVLVAKGTTVGTPEIVDDGLSVAGMPFTDGQHLVGDDSHVFVLSGGEVHVSYQDATSGTLHYAVGAVAATGHTWTVQSPTQDGFAGAFSNIVTVNGQLQLMNWWRTGGTNIAGDVRFVTPM